MAQDWRDDSDSRLTRALVEMEERVEELERRCSMLEDEAGVRLFEDMGMDYEDEPVNGDLEEYLEDRDDDPDDPDFDDPDFLGDFDDDEDEVLEVADSCDSAVLESTHDSQELGGSK